MTAPTHLRCEYFTNPLCIDVPRPRLSWRVNDPRRGAVQSAYQIIVSTGAQDVLWDSGKVQSDQSAQVEYAGLALASRQRCLWKVRTWDAADQSSPWSEAAHWEMGLLRREDWKGQWIGSPVVGGPYTIPPAPYLRKKFSSSPAVISARLYVTALGVYEFEINGRRIGSDIFNPGRTEYRKRVPYHAYDVTSLLRTGENVCGAILGDGWYCGHLHNDPRQTFGDRPRLLAQLELRHTDGKVQTIVSDSYWKTAEGPIRSSDMLMGEDYDARMEIPGWSSPGFDDSGWDQVLVFPDPGIEIVAHRSPPVRAIEQIKPVKPPVSSERTLDGDTRKWLFDLGQNMVGRIRLKVRGPAGTVIALRHVEMLDKDGKPYTQSLRSARATDYYTTRGNGEEVYEPHFTFHGFRYVELRDYPGTPDIDDVTGVVLHSDLPVSGTFECSDPLINKLQRNITWSQKGNFLDIPTDCPQRDERLGWTGDAQVFVRTAAFNMDVAGFFTKWLTDMADSQGEDGHIPSVVPDIKSIPPEGGPAWADAVIICPWTVYLCYGDRAILQTRYPMMQTFMRFLEERCVDFIRADEHWKWKGYGDWLNMNAPTPNDLIGTAYYAHCANLMSKIAKIVNRPADAEKYAKLFENIRQAWAKRFVMIDGSLKVQTQTAHVLALHFELLPEELRNKAATALVEDIQYRGLHLSTGFVGTPYLNHVLTKFGHLDIACTLLTQKTFPSWLYPITQGATTMWERWDAWTHEKGFSDSGMNSFNHYAYGAIGEWMYAVIGGIDLDLQQPGYKHIIIHPRPGGGLTWAKASLETLYGRIETYWRTSDGKFHLDVTIPPNTTATVRVSTPAVGATITESGQPAKPSETTSKYAGFELGAGRYSFIATPSHYFA